MPTPADYRWSSYHFNALGHADELVTPHNELVRLGSTDFERQTAYQALFRDALVDQQINEIRTATE